MYILPAEVLYILPTEVLYLIEFLRGYSKVVSEADRSNLSLDEDQMHHDLHPGDYANWKIHHLKDSFSNLDGRTLLRYS